MLRHYNSYIIRSLLGPLLLITFTLTGIIWLTQSLRFIDFIVNRGLGLASFVYLSSLLLPFLLSIIMPVALYSAILFVYNKLIMDSELVVLKSVGVSRFGLAKPALIIGGGVMLFSYFISLYLLPASYREFKDMQMYIRNTYASVLLQEGVFNSPVKNLTVYIDGRTENGLLQGLLVHDTRNPQAPVTMMAKEGRLIDGHSGPMFELIDGNRQEMDTEKGSLSLLYFDRYLLELDGFIETPGVRIREARERYLPELFFPKNVPEIMVNQLKAEGHHRLIWPAYNMLFTLLALAALLPGQFNRRGQWKRILTASAIAVFAIIIGMMQVNIMARSPLTIPAAYILAILVLTVLYYLIIHDSPKMKSVASPGAEK